MNHGVRGTESDLDQAFVEAMAKKHALPFECGHVLHGPGKAEPGFEAKARDARRRYFLELRRKLGFPLVLLAHTADDQIETILMRFFEGAGIGGLKGIPREKEGGIVHPILDVWKEDILKYLNKNKIPFRIDKSNFDTRFERNWIRHVLIPLLEKRYGKGVKKRIFALGERFRELDEYLESESRKWIRRNVKPVQTAASGRKASRPKDLDGKHRFPRKGFSGLPTVLRVKVLQRLCFDRLGFAPNERLLSAMDQVACTGGPSAKLKVGKGWELANRYDHAVFVRGDTRNMPASSEPVLAVEEKGKVTPAQARRAAASGRKECFDATGIRMPLSVRPLRAGDRIRPFGLYAEKKVKEVLIDRKVPRGERWGRPVVCDGEGTILWIPGVVRSVHAPVTPETKKTILLAIRRTPSRKNAE